MRTDCLASRLKGFAAMNKEMKAALVAEIADEVDAREVSLGLVR